MLYKQVASSYIYIKKKHKLTQFEWILVVYGQAAAAHVS